MEKDTLQVPHPTLVSAITSNVKTKPNKVFLKWVSSKNEIQQTRTYSEVYEQSLRVVHLLQRKGVKRGDRVMIAYPFGLEFVSGLVGCMMAGVIACSVYPPNPSDKSRASYSFQQFNNQVQDSEANFALTTTAFKHVITLASVMGHKTPGLIWLQTDNLKPIQLKQSLNLPMIEPDDVAFIQYTSGSTSSPKGIMITHKGAAYNIACAFVTEMDQGAATNLAYVTWMPQYHDYALVAFFLAALYYSEVTVIAFSPIDFIRNPLLWADVLECHTKGFAKVNTAGPNFAYSLLAKRMEAAKRTLQCRNLWRASIAAEPISPTTLEKMSQVGIPSNVCSPAYGLAEVCAYATGITGDEIRVVDGVVSSGNLDQSKRMGKVIRIADEQGDIVKDGEVGEIFIRSPDMTPGYFQKPELQHVFEVKLSDNREYFATGDLGRAVEGRLYVVGRKKELIIVNGKNIYPTDLERTIEAEYPDIVRPGSTVAFQGEGSTVGLVLELRPEATKSNSFCSNDVSSVLLHAHGVTTSSITVLKKKGAVPKTTSGKLKRVECRRNSLEKRWARQSVGWEWSQDLGSPAAAGVVEPTGQEKHHEVCEEVFMSVVGSHLLMDKSWANNGLSSLQSAELVSVVAEKLRVNLPVDFESKYPTPESLKEFIEVSNGVPFRVHVSELEDPSGDLSQFTVAVLQTLGVMTILFSFAWSLLPPFYLGRWFSKISSSVNVGNSMVATWVWIPVVFPAFALTLSIYVIVLKWVIVGRYKESTINLRSITYLRWWLADRTIHMWELWVGQFLTDTIYIVIFYKLLGARISWTAQLDSFVREFDLVSIGRGSKIEYPIRCRKFRLPSNQESSPYLNMRPVSIGKEVIVRGMVGPGANLGEGVTVEYMASVSEGAEVPARVLAKGVPAYNAGDAEIVGENPVWEGWFFTLVKALWLIAELYIFNGCLLVAQLLLNGRLPATYRYTPLAYWCLVMAILGIFILIVSVVLKWVLIGKRNASHGRTLYRRCAYWICDKHFHLGAYLLWVTLHNSRLWNVILRLHGLDVDLQSFFVDILLFVPSKIDLIRVRRTFFSAELRFDVDGPLDIADCNVAFGVQFKGKNLVVHQRLLPPRGQVVESLVEEPTKGQREMISRFDWWSAICKECLQFALFAVLPLTLVPSYEFFQQCVRNTSIGLALITLPITTLIQYTTWICAIRCVQVIFVRPGINAELYSCQLSFGWALRTYGGTWMLWGTDFFRALARLMGSKVEGRLWYFGSVIYDWKMLHFADGTLVDDCHITGHSATFESLTIAKTSIGGLLHPGCYACAGASIPDEQREHGPCKLFLQNEKFGNKETIETRLAREECA